MMIAGKFFEAVDGYYGRKDDGGGHAGRLAESVRRRCGSPLSAFLSVNTTFLPIIPDE